MRIGILSHSAQRIRVLRRWAAEHGHDIVLHVVGRGSPRFVSNFKDALGAIPYETNILLLTHFDDASVAWIEAQDVDLLISYCFAPKIPRAIFSAPRLGTVNLHPTRLPAYRGSNAWRPFYDGVDTLDMTVHRVDEGWDTGPILAQRSIPAPPEPVGADILERWDELAIGTLDDAMPRVLAGDPGTPQDDDAATYGALFSVAERYVDLTQPVEVLLRRLLALAGSGESGLFHWDFEVHQILHARILDPADAPTDLEPGVPRSISFDRHRWALACEGGFLELHTSQF